MWTELGTVMCHICLFFRDAGEKRFVKIEPGERPMVAVSKPGGGSYGGAGFVTFGFLLVLLRLARGISKSGTFILSGYGRFRQ